MNTQRENPIDPTTRNVLIGVAAVGVVGAIFYALSSKSSATTTTTTTGAGTSTPTPPTTGGAIPHGGGKIGPE